MCRTGARELAAVREALAHRPATIDGDVIRVASPAAIRHIVQVVLGEFSFVDTPWEVELTLEGPSPWRVATRSFVDTIALGFLLDALLPYGAPPRDDEPPIELPKLSGTEQLEHVPPYTAGKLTRAIGEIAGEVVQLETKLRLGRIKTWLHHRGTKSRTFINAGPIAVDVDRVVLAAERDGKAELLSIALPDFSETILHEFAQDEHGINKVPRDLAFHAGRVIQVWTDHDQTRFVREDGSLLVRLPGPLERLDRDGDLVYAFTTDLHRISLADGSVRSAGTHGDKRVEHFTRRGRWYAWSFRDAREIYVADDGTLVRTLTLPEGEAMWMFDLSPGGTLAAISHKDDGYTLHVAYADRTERFRLAGEANVRFRAK